MSSGLYIHIPFCKQACHYCNFHFSTSLSGKSRMIDAIVQEISMRKSYLENPILQTIYFGGGTPSLLTISDLAQIFDAIRANFTIAEDAEITLEANPDDLNLQKLIDLRSTPVNRLSIGIQSFVAEDLKYMNRAHDANEAIQCVKLAQQVGFQNLSLDLIYGTPTLSDEDWAKNIQTVFDFDIPHISCYCLTVEEKTALHHQIKKGKAQPVDEEKASRQFEYLMSAMANKGYEHYEISNFSKPGSHARHNTAYWFGSHYLGIGPSSHSFNGVSRSWNIANNATYMKQVEEGVFEPETEILSIENQYNELVMTSLRTKWGINLDLLKEENQVNYFKEKVIAHIENQHIMTENNVYKLTNSGRLFADAISSDLFM